MSDEPKGGWEGVKQDGHETRAWSVIPAYPDGYHDPEWDGSETEFRDKVIPARLAAIEERLSEQLAPLGLSLRWHQDGT